MKTMRELLKDYEKRLNELTSPLYSDTTTPEVRAILIDTCQNAIENLKRDIEEDENELAGLPNLARLMTKIPYLTSANGMVTHGRTIHWVRFGRHACRSSTSALNPSAVQVHATRGASTANRWGARSHFESRQPGVKN
jgi:hypothetical protein